MVTILMMSEKFITEDLLKIKVFWNKSYDVINYVYDVTNQIWSYDSNHIVDVVMWPKCGNSSISMREVVRTSILTRKTAFFEEWSWFQFNNLGLAPARNMKFYNIVAKGLKKSQKVQGASSYVCRSYRGKAGRRAFLLPPSWIWFRPLRLPTHLSNLTANG